MGKSNDYVAPPKGGVNNGGVKKGVVKKRASSATASASAPPKTKRSVRFTRPLVTKTGTYKPSDAPCIVHVQKSCDIISTKKQLVELGAMANELQKQIRGLQLAVGASPKRR